MRPSRSSDNARNISPVLMRALNSTSLARKPDHGGIPPSASQPADMMRAAGSFVRYGKSLKSCQCESETLMRAAGLLLPAGLHALQCADTARPAIGLIRSKWMPRAMIVLTVKSGEMRQPSTNPMLALEL